MAQILSWNIFSLLRGVAIFKTLHDVFDVLVSWIGSQFSAGF